jgi:hypothetical protein
MCEEDQKESEREENEALRHLPRTSHFDCCLDREGREQSRAGDPKPRGI